MPRNGWNDYKKLVLHEMEENGKRFEHISNTMLDLQKDVAGLKVKAALVGGIAGLVGTGLLTFVAKLFN